MHFHLAQLWSRRSGYLTVDNIVALLLTYIEYYRKYRYCFESIFSQVKSKKVKTTNVVSYKYRVDVIKTQ